MGLDIDFHDGDDDLLHLRDHHDFLDLFLSQGVQEVRPGFSDFYVDMSLLDAVAADLQHKVRRLGLMEEDLPLEITESFWSLDARVAPCKMLLGVYPLLVQILRRAVRERGAIICSWSA